MRVLLIILITGCVQISLKASALAKYWEGDPRKWNVSGGSLAYERCSLPEEVYKEFTVSYTLQGPLAYLAQVASDPSSPRQTEAKRLIVQALYLTVGDDSVRSEHQRKEGFVSFGVPRILWNAIMQGFPEDDDGWEKWIDDVVPRIRDRPKQKPVEKAEP